MIGVKFIAFVFLCTTSCTTGDVIDADVIDAVSADVSTEPAVMIDKDRAGNEPVKYDGAQLWRIDYTEQKYRNAVSELQKQFKTSMWNLQMTNASGSFVDMFVTRTAVNDARSFLENVRVPFDVVIDDVQDAINNENPPLEQTHLWQNRDGE